MALEAVCREDRTDVPVEIDFSMRSLVASSPDSAKELKDKAGARMLRGKYNAAVRLESSPSLAVPCSAIPQQLGNRALTGR